MRRELSTSHGRAESRLCASGDTIRFRWHVAFCQARALSKDHASLHSLAFIHGRADRCLRDSGWFWASCCQHAEGGCLGIDSVADCGVSSQCLYGHPSYGGRRGFDRPSDPLGTAAHTRIAHSVVVAVYKAPRSLVYRYFDLHGTDVFVGCAVVGDKIRRGTDYALYKNHVRHVAYFLPR